MSRQFDVPVPGDLIIVGRSGWYALKDGEVLRVCENAGWVLPGQELYVAPRHKVTTFWGPHHGPPDGVQKEQMSTSGGPFKTIQLKLITGLSFQDRTTDTFWHWTDWPRAGGGTDYLRDVSRWTLPYLPDRTWSDDKEGSR